MSLGKIVNLYENLKKQDEEWNGENNLALSLKFFQHAKMDFTDQFRHLLSS